MHIWMHNMPCDKIYNVHRCAGLTITAADVTPLETFSTCLDALTPPSAASADTGSADMEKLQASGSLPTNLLLLGVAAVVVLLAVVYQMLLQ